MLSNGIMAKRKQQYKREKMKINFRERIVKGNIKFFKIICKNIFINFEIGKGFLNKI